MNIDNAIALIKFFEGFNEKAYHYDQWTIGYGFTGSWVTEGMVMSLETAEDYLRQVVAEKETMLQDFVKIKLEENIHNAVLSFFYNAVPEQIYSSRFLELLNQGNFDGALERMLLYVNTYVNGERVQELGLVRRRRAEAILWKTGKIVTNETVLDNVAQFNALLTNRPQQSNLSIPTISTTPHVTPNLALPVPDKGGFAWIRVETDQGYLKRSIAQSSQLPDDQKYLVKKGLEFAIACWVKEDRHIRFTLDLAWAKENNFALGHYNTWYAFDSTDFIKLEPVNAPAAASTPTSVQEQVTRKLLKVPYLLQLDNSENPYGSCNVTSVAMCMAFFGHPIRNNAGVQLEDELYQYCIDSGLNRHVGEDLAELFRVYGYKDEFTRHTSWDAVKAWLDKENPCIVHGYFTEFGHIIVIIGYNEKGFVVNDPYGEFFTDGYDTTRSGAGLTYSYNLMARTCSADGELWIHFVSK